MGVGALLRCFGAHAALVELTHHDAIDVKLVNQLLSAVLGGSPLVFRKLDRVDPEVSTGIGVRVLLTELLLAPGELFLGRLLSLGSLGLPARLDCVDVRELAPLFVGMLLLRLVAARGFAALGLVILAPSAAAPASAAARW